MGEKNAGWNKRFGRGGSVQTSATILVILFESSGFEPRAFGCLTLNPNEPLTRQYKVVDVLGLWHLILR